MVNCKDHLNPSAELDGRQRLWRNFNVRAVSSIREWRGHGGDEAVAVCDYAGENRQGENDLVKLQDGGLLAVRDERTKMSTTAGDGGERRGRER
jgi:hypothetical protein